MTAYNRGRVRARRGATPQPLDSTCECCGRVAKLVHDHDHATGLHRGWLCSPCNSGLGMFGDDMAGLELAVAYLSSR